MRCSYSYSNVQYSTVDRGPWILDSFARRRKEGGWSEEATGDAFGGVSGGLAVIFASSRPVSCLLRGPSSHSTLVTGRVEQLIIHTVDRSVVTACELLKSFIRLP
jgi:hypothetical protein